MKKNMFGCMRAILKSRQPTEPELLERARKIAAVLKI
jgi:hypothetical protein